MKKLNFYFLIPLILIISCEKSKNIEKLTPQEDSLKTAMSTRFTSQQINEKYEQRIHTKLLPDSILAQAFPEKLLNMKRDTIRPFFEKEKQNPEFRTSAINAIYRNNDTIINLNISDCSENFASLTMKTTMIMETEYVNKILENGFEKSQVYKGHILRTRQTTENGQVQSNIKMQFKERYFADIYGTNIPVDQLKLAISEIKYQDLPN